MCGIAGFVQSDRGQTTEESDSLLRAMTDTMTARGPDSSGYWLDAPAGVGLGHRRLAIRDLSPTGHQPMISSCGRYVIVYNGEVYSHREMRTDLEAAGRSFRGSSDTEVILEACAEWGVDRAAKRLIGMFAFALYDRRTRDLHLVRDRLGIKPLYWGHFSGLFLFASELKAMRRHTGWRPTVDRNAVSAFMRHNYIPGPHSIYQNVHKLTPGTILTVSGGVPGSERTFWSLDDVVSAGQHNRFAGPDEQAVGALDSLLSDAVRRRMVSDVPLGALLSGGIDSSVVTALMQSNSSRPVRTFSIGFREDGFNEAPFAKAVATHLGTDHTELYVEPGQALEIVPKLPHWFDEPFADSSQLPTFLVCELTRQHVTVVLSGDGGDELFGGYTRYERLRTVSQASSRIPGWLRGPGSRLMQRISPRSWERLGHLLPSSIRPADVGERMYALANGVNASELDGMYRQMLSHWHDPDAVVIRANEPHGALWNPEAVRRVPDFGERMQYYDTLTYLPDDILTKIDRTSMAVSLEARIPLLDHRIVEFAWTLPDRYKWRGGESKWILRQVLDKYVPRPLIDRPKMGFGVPFDRWLRGPLRAWAEDLLAEPRFARDRLLDPAPIRQRWKAHLAGENWGYPLWNVLMLHAWLDANPDVSLG